MQSEGPKVKTPEVERKEVKYRWMEPLRGLGKYPHIISDTDHHRLAVVFVGFDPAKKSFERVYIPFEDVCQQGGEISSAMKKATNASRALRKALMDIVEDAE